MEISRQSSARAGATVREDFRIRQLRARDMLRGDLEGDELEKYVEERVLTTTLDKAVAWARGNAMFPATFGLACCAIEMMSIVAARVDVARFGFEAFRASPRQADLLILSGRVSIKMAPVVRRIYDQMLEPKWAIAMGACSSSMGVFNNYAIVPADKFMPVDVHVPGCPPRPEALMHGILKLRTMIQEDPDDGLARRATARAAPRRSCPGPTSDVAAVNVFAPGGHRGCLTRPASSCSPRSCARPTPTSVLDTAVLPRPGHARSSHPRAIRETLAAPARARASRFLASVHGVDYYPEEPRLGVHYELLDMESARPPDGQAARPARRARVAVGDARLADRRPPGARGLRHVRRASSTATPTCAGSSCPRTTRATRSAATSRSAASRSCSPTTRPRARTYTQ